ncbi:MAG: HU family DNA-binding protein [Desulfobacterales bacterium]|jgi:DNA-binding protein HU-beta|nr:HU family DNA-binding protein [Desulfobacterales bacterium]MDH3826555.1 HU family DNA-binding protein [Desulfobacterales bacterium]MDH3876628.1 HU family DNA-binding protein [Desulfobacterales bacterium]
MNKADLISEVTKVVSTKKEAQAAVNCVFACIPKAMKKGSPVTIAGFGSFKVAKRKARKGRNPKTGEAIKIKAAKAPKFVASKTLKDFLN